MTRVVLYLLGVGLLAIGAAWLADRPGDVAITWQGWRIETSVMVMILAIVVIVLVAMLLWSALRLLVRSPGLLSLRRRSRRGARAYQAISRGLIAIGSGDAAAARKFSDEARRIAPAEPLTLLLTAQSAQLNGDRGIAERAFRAMASRDDTKLLGLHGLFVEALRREDSLAARLYAEEAARTTPSLAWASEAVLGFRSTAGDWAGALEALERNWRAKLIDKAAYQRKRAVLLTARAQAAEENDRDNAKAWVSEAVKLAPDLVPAAVLAARFLAEAGDLRRASRVIEAAWRAGPHPDLADTYGHIRFGDSARDRLKRVQTLAQKAPGHIEGALAVARAACEAQEFALARATLAPLLAAPTQRVAMLMAEIERAEHGDEGRAREWMARAVHAARDPAWTADGVVSDRWLPVSPVTGQLDAFQWRVPLAELGVRAPVIEAPLSAVLPPQPPTAPADAVVEATAALEPAPATETASAPEAAPAAAPTAPAPRRRAQPAPVEQVIPLVRAPDDPGPEPEPASEETIQTNPQTEGWRRLGARNT